MPEGNENDDSGVTPTETSENTEGLKRALEAQKRKAREAEKQLAQLRLQMAEKAKQEDATKSEMDKLVERVKATDERLAKAERRALVSEVAAKTGLSVAKVDRLKGETVEELLTDAAEIFDWKEDADKPAGEDKPSEEAPADKPAGERELPASGRPTETLRPGAVPGSANDKTPEQIADAILTSGF